MDDVTCQLKKRKVDSSILSLTTTVVFTFPWGPFSRLGLTFWCVAWCGRGFCCSGCVGWLAGDFARVPGWFAGTLPLPGSGRAGGAGGLWCSAGC